MRYVIAVLFTKTIVFFVIYPVAWGVWGILIMLFGIWIAYESNCDKKKKEPKSEGTCASKTVYNCNIQINYQFIMPTMVVDGKEKRTLERGRSWRSVLKGVPSKA